MTSSKKQVQFLWVTVIVIIGDQLSKYWANHHLYPGAPREIFNWLNLTLRYNTGAAFSFLANQGHWHSILLAAISLCVSLFLLRWLWRSTERGLTPVALSLILGGAVGNLIERLWRGYVTDFIDFHIGTWHFATFNVADSAITVGVVLLACTMVLKKSESA